MKTIHAVVPCIFSLFMLVGLAGCPITVPPVLSISAKELVFAPDENSKTIDITNSGGGILRWSAASDSDWLATSPASGKQDGPLTVTVDRTAMGAKDSLGTVEITSNGGDATVTVQVQSSQPDPPLLKIMQTTLNFGLSQGPLPLQIRNNGSGGMNWSIQNNLSWLSFDRISGTGDADVLVSVKKSVLAAGTNAGSFIVQSNGGDATITASATCSTNAGSAYWPMAAGNRWSYTLPAIVGGAGEEAFSLNVVDKTIVGGLDVWRVDVELPFAGIPSVPSGDEQAGAKLFAKAIGHNPLTTLLDRMRRTPIAGPLMMLNEPQTTIPTYWVTTNGECYIALTEKALEHLPDTSNLMKLSSLERDLASLVWLLAGSGSGKYQQSIQEILNAASDASYEHQEELEAYYNTIQQGDLSRVLDLLEAFGARFEGYESSNKAIKEFMGVLASLTSGAEEIQAFASAAFEIISAVPSQLEEPIQGISSEMAAAVMENCETALDELLGALGEEGLYQALLFELQYEYQYFLDANPGFAAEHPDATDQQLFYIWFNEHLSPFTMVSAVEWVYYDHFSVYPVLYLDVLDFFGEDIISLTSAFSSAFSGYQNPDTVCEHLVRFMASGAGDLAVMLENRDLYTEDELDELLVLSDELLEWLSENEELLLSDPIAFMDELKTFLLDWKTNAQGQAAMEALDMALGLLDAGTDLVEHMLASPVFPDGVSKAVQCINDLDTFFAGYAVDYPDNSLAIIAAIMTAAGRDIGEELMVLDPFLTGAQIHARALKDAIQAGRSTWMTPLAYRAWLSSLAEFFSDYSSSADDPLATVMAIWATACKDISDQILLMQAEIWATPVRERSDALSAFLPTKFQGMDFIQLSDFASGDLANCFATEKRISMPESDGAQTIQVWTPTVIKSKDIGPVLLAFFPLKSANVSSARLP